MENLEPAAKEAKKPAAEILTKKSSSHAWTKVERQILKQNGKDQIL
jgi:hypothetical protein